ncbi:hypothetical protein AAG570_009827 [Ranatra chinensis]|uniref:Uncharacterized protein n=1 Tax=Ranatra chinensis TaxID=642074 RepID=A0ABD0YQ70_9HEMI
MRRRGGLPQTEGVSPMAETSGGVGGVGGGGRGGRGGRGGGLAGGLGLVGAAAGAAMVALWCCTPSFPATPAPHLHDYCRLSTPSVGCISGYGLLQSLYNRCGHRPRRPPIVERPPEALPPEEEKDKSMERDLEALRLALESTPTPRQTAPPSPPPQAATDRPQLIYQIIIILLLVSVTTSLVDCFKQRYNKFRPQDDGGGANGGPEGAVPGAPGSSRRMSLADLTMSRHYRKESQQQAYRPTGPSPKQGPLTRRRSMPGHHRHHQQDDRSGKEMVVVGCGRSRTVTRQSSCPQPSSVCAHPPSIARRLSSFDLQHQPDEEETNAYPRRRNSRSESFLQQDGSSTESYNWCPLRITKVQGPQFESKLFTKAIATHQLNSSKGLLEGNGL